MMTTLREDAGRVKIKPDYMVVTRNPSEEVLRIKPLEVNSTSGTSGTSYERLSPDLPVPKYFTFDSNDIVGLGDSSELPSDGVVEPASSLFPKLKHGDVVAVGEKLTRLKPVPLGVEDEDITAGLGQATAQETMLFKAVADKFKTLFTYPSDAEVSPVYTALTFRMAGDRPASSSHTIRFLQHYDNRYGIPEDRAENTPLTQYQRQIVARIREAVPRPI
jgi:hypothetical protein